MADVPAVPPAKRQRTESTPRSADDAPETPPPLAVDVSAIVRRSKRDWPVLDPKRAPLSHTRSVGPLVAAHHVPHDASRIEWWYVNGHINADYSFFAAFFRLVTDDVAATPPSVAHALNWALVDLKSGAYHTFSQQDHRAPEVVLELIQRTEFRGDRHVVAALCDLLRRGEMPAPDAVMPRAARCDADRLHLDYNGNVFRALPPAVPGGPERFALTLRGVLPGEPGTSGAAGGCAAGTQVALDVTLVPSKGAILHGVNGTVSLGANSATEDMFYYFIPHCDTTGTLTLAPPPNTSAASGAAPPPAASPVVVNVLGGAAWIDHEFGGTVPATKAEFAHLLKGLEERRGLEHAWEWAALQLNNSTEVSVTLLSDPNTGRITDCFAIVHESDGTFERVEKNAVVFESDPTSLWTSPVTGMQFPTKWAVEFTTRDDMRVTLELAAPFQDQEFVTVAAKPSYWEGFVAVRGRYGSEIVSGRGFVECHGRQDLHSVATYYDLMHSLLCEPFEKQVPKMPQFASAPRPIDAAAVVAAYQPFVAVGIEMAAGMLSAAAPDQDPLNAPQKAVLAAVVAAYLAVFHHGGTETDTPAATAEPGSPPIPTRVPDALFIAAVRAAVAAQWEAQRSAMRNDFKRLLLHAFASFVADKAAAVWDSSLAAAAAPATSANNSGANGEARPSGWPERLVPSTAEELARAATPEEVAVAQTVFSGLWVKDTQRSDSISNLLGAQGVNFAIRAIMSRLAPSLETTVRTDAISTRVSCLGKAEDHVVGINGREWTWKSNGRGVLRCAASLQDGGRVLYTRSNFVDRGPAAVEHKWSFVIETNAASGPVLVDVQKFTPPGSNAEVSATQYFRKRTA